MGSTPVGGSEKSFSEYFELRTLLRYLHFIQVTIHLSVKILSTDLSKAFDSLHPSLMISKLKAYGFQDELRDLLRSYLCNRLNRVKLGAIRSEWKRTDSGCPQGSALGPLLWNIFQNDLTYVTTSHLSVYADDHQMYETVGDPKMANTNFIRNANRASEWYASNLLKGNLHKYQTMTLKQNRTEGNTPLNFQGNTIESSDCLKLLGVTIDEQLNFNTHINEICKKASQRVGVMLRLKNLIPTNAKLTLYKSAILPYLTYCHLTWHFCSATDKRKLERIQERALRTVFLDKQSSYQVLLDKSDLMTLQNRRLQDTAILMYKVKHKLCVCVCVCACLLSVCVYVCMCVCMYVCMYVYMYPISSLDLRQLYNNCAFRQPRV